MGQVIRLNEKQFNDVVINAVNTILEHEVGRVLYTAQIVDDPDTLMRKYPTQHPNKYYHHSTNLYGKQPFDEREGEKMRLHIVGRLVTDKVDALVVENPNSSNEIPHITLGTANGVKPVASNYELRDNYSMVEPLDDYVDTTFANIMAK